jgi:DNA repair protein RadC
MENTKHAALWQVPEIELTYRSTISVEQMPIIICSRDSFEILRQSWNPDNIGLYESFKILLLNNTLKAMGVVEVARGGINGIAVDLRLIYAAALKCRAASIVLAHNHPSGNLMPSREDILLTTKAQEGAKLLNIQIADHIIITTDKYYSFSDEGIL